jgi:DNA recombination protein Rad52
MKTAVQTNLDENIPKDVIATRDGGGTRKLSYLEAWYVIDRMNQVFGQGNWGYHIVSLHKVFEGELEQYSGKAFSTSYIATVQTWAKVDGVMTQFTDVGYGDGTDKKSPGKAHELATKEAVSDAIKRSCKNFGRSMGLALYDKTQEFVGQSISQPVESSLSTNGNGHATNGNGHASGASGVASPEVHAGREVSGKLARPIKELIAETFQVLKIQGKITGPQFKKKYQEGKALSDLTETQLSGILNKVNSDFPELKGASNA